MASDIRQIRKALIQQGWRLDDSGKHTKAYSPDRVTIVTLPKTPGDHRGIANAISQLRKGGFIWPPKGGK